MKTLIVALFLNVYCYASSDTCIVILHKKTTMKDVVKQKFNFDNLFLYNDTLYDKAFLKSKNVVWNDSLENEMISKIDYKIFKFYRDGILVGSTGWYTESLFGQYLQYDKRGQLRVKGWHSAQRSM